MARKGWTAVETIIVVAICAILAAIVIPSVLAARDKNMAAKKADVQQGKSKPKNDRWWEEAR